MGTSRKQVGDLGEGLACSYLESRGHTILRKNWRIGHLEVDIISRDAQGLHFVEVKSRVAPLTADPQEAATGRKMARIARAANGYLAHEGLGTDEVFFDIVSVVFDGGKTDIQYFPQAYIPVYY